MKAVAYEGVKTMKVEDRPKPQIQSGSDALLRVTTSGICGSDLHMYDGRTPLKEGTIVGHEIMGVIEDVGQAVNSIKKGDRVVLPFNIACGYCYNCLRGLTNLCLTTNPETFHAAYGYAGMGPYSGGQAEFVVVPYADFNCLKVPGTPGDQWEDDFLLLSDVFPTGYHGTELACVTPGKSVAVFGAGPVGLLAAYSSILKGASEVYVIDAVGERLTKAKELGAIPIDFAEGDPVDQILNLRKNNKALQGRLRPGEEKSLGVDCIVDAVGYQARDAKNPSRERATQVIDSAARLINAGGHIGVVGVYMSPDPGAENESAKQGIFPLPWGDLFDKAVTIGTGQTPVKRYNEYLRDMIISGRAKPSKIVSHHIRIEEAPLAYRKFDERSDGYTKVLIRFEQRSAAD